MDPQMTPERYARVTEVVADALKLQPTLRERFLEESCQDDAIVLREAGALLDYEDTRVDLEEPIFETLRPAPQESWEGRRVGRYRILKPIGEGGMGSVFLAQREADDFEMTVALKVIRPGQLQPETLRSFHEERQTLAGLDHPNIARILDGGSSDNGPYFAMEYVEGQPIDRYCEENQLPIRERLQLFRQVCSAVQEAHRHLLVHRDVKASNILVTRDGVTKLIDFGIAKPADNEGQQPAELGPMTVEIAAPEQIRGEPITTATDVYALGQLLSKLLARQGAPNPRELAGDLGCIIRKALNSAPQDRYTSAEQLGEEIRRFLENLPVKAHRQTWTYRGRKFARRQRWPLAGAAFLLALSTSFWHQTAKERDKASSVIKVAEAVLKLSDPDESTPEGLATRDLLRRADEVISSGLKDQPLFQARLATTIGRLYQDWGDFNRSQELLERALQLKQQVLTQDDPLIAASMSNLAALLLKMGLPDEAEEYATKALEIQRKSGNKMELSRGLSNEGYRFYEAEEYERAEEFFREALDIQQVNSGNPIDQVTTMMNLAAALSDQGEFEEAEKIYRHGMEIRIDALGQNHTDVAKSLNSLAALLRNQGRYIEAESLLHRALMIRENRLRADHPYIAKTFYALGRVAQESGDLILAEERYKKAHEILESSENPQLMAKVEKKLTELAAAIEAGTQVE